MGYPMTYRRVVGRNQLQGGYGENCDRLDLIRGDLRRLERDQRDDTHLTLYAERAGITIKQAKTVLDAFFDGL